MKAALALVALFIFAPRAQAQFQVTDFNLKADKTYSLNLNGEGFSGTFEKSDAEVVKTSGGTNLHVYRHGKMIVVGAVKAEAKNGFGQIFIFEEMNSLFIPLTLSAINGAAPNFSADLERMVEISRLANGGDVEEGLRKIVAHFRQSPKQTVQNYIAKAGARGTGPIPVGQRNRIQSVRSFEELEGGKPVATSPRVPVRRHRPPVRRRAKPSAAAVNAPRAQAPLDLRPSARPFPFLIGR